jgi:hypothetical protein
LLFLFLAGTAVGVGISDSETFCLFVRLFEEALEESGSGIGLGSRAGAFRFRECVADLGWEGTAVGVAEAADGEVPGLVAACLADRRVILEDMSELFSNVRSL